MEKLNRMIGGQSAVMSDDELDLLANFDVSNLIRSKPNSKQCGLLDRWECWIEQRDVKRFYSNRR
jgi:hypothetical protein